MTPSIFPSPEDGLALHQQMMDEPTKPIPLCELFLAPVVHFLSTRYPGIDDHLWFEAAHDAILGYLRNPGTFDPRKGDLGAYLRMAAEGDLINFLASRRRRRKRFSENSVELDEFAGNLPVEPPDELNPILAEVRSEMTPTEVSVFELMLAGEKSTRAYALVLGLQDRAQCEQKRAVKQVKDRLMKRLQRRGNHGQSA